MQNAPELPASKAKHQRAHHAQLTDLQKTHLHLRMWVCHVGMWVCSVCCHGCVCAVCSEQMFSMYAHHIYAMYVQMYDTYAAASVHVFFFCTTTCSLKVSFLIGLESLVLESLVGVVLIGIVP